jgi:hypothetical protein
MLKVCTKYVRFAADNNVVSFNFFKYDSRVKNTFLNCLHTLIRVTLIHINQPTQHYVNNTMNIIQIFKHFNINKCFEFPVNILSYLHRSLHNIILCPMKAFQFYNWFVKYRDVLKNIPFKVPKGNSKHLLILKCLNI